MADVHRVPLFDDWEKGLAQNERGVLWHFVLIYFLSNYGEQENRAYAVAKQAVAIDVAVDVTLEGTVRGSLQMELWVRGWVTSTILLFFFIAHFFWVGTLAKTNRTGPSQKYRYSLGRFL